MSILRRHRDDVRDGLLVTLVTAVLIVILFHPWPGRLRTPMAYDGDALQAGQIVDTTIHHGWYQTEPRLGAPRGLQYYDFPLEADNANLLFIRILGFGSHDWALVLNAFYLAGFVLAALTAYFVLRALTVSRAMALVAAQLFAFLPYHFIRGEGHFLLSSYFMVPVGILVAVWLMSDAPPFCRVEESRLVWDWRSRRGWISVVACLLLASTGLYYAVFGAMLMLIGALFALLRRFELPRLLAGIAVAGTVGAGLVLNFLPSIFYVLVHGSNPAVAHRYPSETDAFGLRIGQLLTPVTGHRIHALAVFSSKAVDRGDAGLGEYLGVVGAIGLFVVVFGALAIAARRRPRADAPDAVLIGQLGVLCIAMMLIGSTGGVARVTAVIAGAEIRAWYRICVLIAFCALAGMALWADRLLVRARSSRWFGRPFLPQLAVVAILVVGLLDQTNSTIVPNLTKWRGQYSTDAAFVSQIQTILGPGRSVFQLPYLAFPESPPVGRVAGYDQFVGFLHSQTLRWSFGAVNGRDDWQSAVSHLPAPRMLEVIAIAGFDGLWIDRYGYPQQARALEAAVERTVPVPPLVSRDGRRSFFDLRAYRRALDARMGAAAVARARAAILDPTTLTWGSGFYAAETSTLGVGHWSASRATLVLRNPGSTHRVVLDFDTIAAAPGPATLRVRGRSVRVDVGVSNRVAHVQVPFDLRHGDTTLTFTNDALPVAGATPTRDPRVGVWNTRLQGVDLVVGDTAPDTYATAPPMVVG